MGLKIVATPIGNLSDMSQRAIETLKSVDAVLCEDTRRTFKIMSYFQISKRLISFNDKNAQKKIPELVKQMRSGNEYALVSDAGMPVISDPGMKLVNECHESGIPVDVIPGPSAPVCAVAASGLNVSHFVFLGFLPRGSKLRKLMRQMHEIEIPIVFFESPYRIKETLKEICTFDPSARIFIAREMTKVNQTFYRGNPCDLSEKVDAIGEITVVVEWCT
ncbi:MAG: 16S rRNA (cytidine(1402)-2'-O)-methyltransferase [Thermotogae bacterium]|jgi:16S rRNA (cytidine1402-2'-O)-methyltransferase|nr:16S rRNA (cytidine(1402)-2'-O)-methyltransferase [Thermotogota bacterium]